MNAPMKPIWRACLSIAAIAGVVAIGAIAAVPSPAQARVWVSGPCCGWYGPGPYYGYYPPPYYYTPPAASYYPPAYQPPAAGPAPSAYTPQSAYPAPSPAAAGAAVAITYTSKPAFTNAAGQTCREFKTNSGQPVYGTACRMADGQWRVTN